MTTVQFMRETLPLPGGAGGEQLRLIVSGHAGYGEKGRDIVCAAESMLVQALACSLAGMDRAQLYDFTVEGVAGSGCVGISALADAAHAERVRGMFAMTVTGFGLLAQHYPEYVRVQLRPEREEKADA
jgi:uncharacterized protein YsxB (DUF464 family)